MKCHSSNRWFVEPNMPSSFSKRSTVYPVLSMSLRLPLSQYMTVIPSLVVISPNGLELEHIRHGSRIAFIPTRSIFSTLTRPLSLLECSRLPPWLKLWLQTLSPYTLTPVTADAVLFRGRSAEPSIVCLGSVASWLPPRKTGL